MKYSQNEEQQYITDYFLNYNNGRGGKFLEIGAYSPFTFSNTRALFETGFSGIYCEPDPTCMQAFKDEYKNEPRIQLLQYAITDTDGTTVFYSAGGDAVGTTDIAHKQKWEAGSSIRYSEIHVATMSMQTLLSRYGAEVDFLNLDVEGTNFHLFSLLPPDFLNRLKCICIEHDNRQNEIIQILTGYGFRTILINGENLIMVK